uniref:NAD(P) transhydrogenase subunit alpha part 1 n=1 Tax=Candidatus Kentrum sp. MB TaxID=2138164 RepID=A0A451BBC0_9GAMM|nr:MAG: NAD(P) transhydrogenase subunit alpha [Candidatus Kentron sp. MB]VFK31785.1 MAG: NAD(P) transhydrogenase subunit alpha [Candidatus Kentron sp. MB]VFK75562.1 MAG: NAD(P) transhydrogenase subunit alpha [Candidatus Kentron sp. MB]
MKLGVPKETVAGEARVATSPDMVKKFCGKGFAVCVERSAGESACFADDLYAQAGAQLVDATEALSADLVLKVSAPTPDEIDKMKSGAVLCALLDPCRYEDTLAKLTEKGITALAMELIPRTTRAQSMDVLSSQAGIAGYRAVIEAATRYPRFFPMMMTSAGAARPAKLIVLGAGVAGLQAIATARRMGCDVEAFDVRPAVREEIQSLGAKFIDLDVGESGAGEGGYARELSEEGKKQQQKALTEYLKKANVIISTALIPCRPAPVLITEEAVRGLAKGSIIVDMAAASGGNCPLSEPDQVVVRHDVTIIGYTNYPSMVPTDASAFYARNLFNLVSILIEEKEGNISWKDFAEDDISKAATITRGGEVVYQRP